MRVIPAVSVAIVRENRVLLVERGQPPSQGQFAFPGGRLEAGETGEDAARREVMEETGILLADVEPLRRIVLSGDRDGEAVEYHLQVYLAPEATGEPQAGSDAAKAAFYSLAELEKLPLTDSTRVLAMELLAGT